MTWCALHTIILLSTLTLVSSQSCNTDQNPYCRGNSQFEQLCCPYPNVCYWSDREGTPACCPAGSSCQNGAGGTVVAPQPTTIYTTYTTPTSTTQPSYSTVTSYVTNPSSAPPVGGVVVVTATKPSLYSTATSAVGGAYSTVTSNVVGAYSTVTSNVVGAYSTVTTYVGGAASTVTSNVAVAATTALEVFTPSEADKTTASDLALAVAVAVAIWQLV